MMNREHLIFGTLKFQIDNPRNTAVLYLNTVLGLNNKSDNSQLFSQHINMNKNSNTKGIWFERDFTIEYIPDNAERTLSIVFWTS